MVKRANLISVINWNKHFPSISVIHYKEVDLKFSHLNAKQKK